MKLALLATLVTFAGSIAGFQAVTAAAPIDGVAAQPAVVKTQDDVTVKKDRDCPFGKRAGADEA